MEVDGVSVGIGEDLHLDMPGAGDHPLHEEGAVSEGGCRLAAAPLERFRHGGPVGHQANAPAAPAGRRLQHHRIAELLGPGRCLLDRPHRGTARDHRDPERRRHRSGPGLVAEKAERTRSRAHEGQPGGRRRLGKGRALGEEPVARMDQVAPGLEGGRHQGAGVEIGRHRIGPPVPADRTGLGDHARVQAERIGRGVHAHGLEPQAGRGPGHPDRDLAPIGDQHSALRHLPLPPDWWPAPASGGRERSDEDAKRGRPTLSHRVEPSRPTFSRVPAH